MRITQSLLSIKNVQFTKLLKAQGSLREFNFRKSILGEKVIFNIDVTDERGNRVLFYMEKQNDFWKIQTSHLPAWIIAAEQDLHDAIEQELKIEV